jgi:hypothetical protein
LKNKNISFLLACFVLFAGASAIILAFASPEKTIASKPKYLILGASQIVIPPQAMIGAQIDRVIRDVNVFNEKHQFSNNRSPFCFPIEDQKEIINYHEGRLVRRLMNYAKARVIGLTPCYARRINGEYWASDGNGSFLFFIKPLRLKYSTAMYNCVDEALLLDTHGFHLVAGQAIRINKLAKLQVVVACMDQSAKAEAALMLAQNGINCFAPCDQFAGELAGYRKKYPKAATIIPTAPIRQNGQGATIGNQPVKIHLDEPIIVQNNLASEGDDDYYCNTAARYFKNLNSAYGLNLKITEVLADVTETEKLVAKAKEIKAKVIAARIMHHLDKPAIANWLKESKEHRAILFHSAAYVAGLEMFDEFPEQTSFGDLDPKFE